MDPANCSSTGNTADNKNTKCGKSSSNINSEDNDNDKDKDNDNDNKNMNTKTNNSKNNNDNEVIVGPGERKSAPPPAAAPAANSRAKLEAASEIDKLKNQMGKLWWAESSQDLRRKYERDRFGRLLIPNEERLGGRSDNLKKMSDTPMSTTAGVATATTEISSTANNSSCDSNSNNHINFFRDEWLAKPMLGFDRAASNWFKTLHSRKSSGLDDKFHYSLALADHMDKLWSKELYHLGVQEREDIINEIHGVQSNRAIRETPEIISEGVQALRDHIDANIDNPVDNGDSIVPPITKDAYSIGINELKSDYILTKAFLLKFLRAALFDIEKAAQRYFRYLDLIYELFGKVSLTRPLALADLTKREIRYLKKGQMQLLPSRDGAGRRMYAFSGCDDWTFNIREKYRTNVYIIDVLSMDETTQKLGAVSLNAPRIGTGNNPFGFEGMTLRLGKQELLGGKFTEGEFFRKVNEAAPVRMTGIHYYFPNKIINTIAKAIILSLLGKDHRKIVRFHFGSQLECEYSLRAFGVPHEDLTITDGGNIKTKSVQKFINAMTTIEMFRKKQIERRQQQEKRGEPLGPLDDEPGPGIACPELESVIFGDKTMNNHPANVEFRQILKILGRDREEQLAHSQDIPVPPINELIERILLIATSPDYNLRFLTYDRKTHLFVKIENHNELCKKVSQTLRDQRKRVRLEDSRCVGGGSVAESQSQMKVTGNRSKQQQTEDGQQGQCALNNGSIMGADAAKRLKRNSGSNGCLPAFFTRYN